MNIRTKCLRGYLILCTCLAAAASAQDIERAGPLRINYSVNLTGAVPMQGAAERVIHAYPQSCAQPKEPMHRGTLKIPGHEIELNIIVAGLSGDTEIPPRNLPHTKFDREITYVAIDHRDEGKVELVFGIGEESAGGKAAIVYKPDGSGSLTFSRFSNLKGDLASGTVTWTCTQERAKTK